MTFAPRNGNRKASMQPPPMTTVIVADVETLETLIDSAVAKALAAQRSELATIQATAVRFGVSTRTINRLISTGRLRTVKVGTRRLVPFEAIEALLSTGEHP
jgi:excisionase family DNA binding protein